MGAVISCQAATMAATPGIFTAQQRRQAEGLRRLTYCNPFLPERIECERAVLGEEFRDPGSAWSLSTDASGGRHNLVRLKQLAETLVTAAHGRLRAGSGASEADLGLYEDLASYVLYYRAQETINGIISGSAAARGGYEAFLSQVQQWLAVPGVRLPVSYRPAHLFALFYQVRRAFLHIYGHIAGRSMPAARLRAAVWESIFTHDIARYRRSLYERMGEMTTLITGPSGTGKELVARAIALSRYIPFDEQRMAFADEAGAAARGAAGGSFFPLNVSALSPTLVESELFGHRRGAFTGATADRAGWLQTCGGHGTVFLDEVGEIDPVIQVKLLRVLQMREFQRLGDTATRVFRGKIIAATNRDLGEQMAVGRFRRDFYYRLCSDQVRTPGLAEQLADRPEELRELVGFVARRVAGEGAAEALADEVVAVVERSLGPNYPWPGNFRELEQCVRNVLVRREYRAATTVAVAAARSGRDREEERRGEWVEMAASARLTAEQLMTTYARRVYAEAGSYEQTARRLGVDRRTVRAWVGKR